MKTLSHLCTEVSLALLGNTDGVNYIQNLEKKMFNANMNTESKCFVALNQLYKIL